MLPIRYASRSRDVTHPAVEDAMVEDPRFGQVGALLRWLRSLRYTRVPGRNRNAALLRQYPSLATAAELANEAIAGDATSMRILHDRLQEAGRLPDQVADHLEHLDRIGLNLNQAADVLDRSLQSDQQRTPSPLDYLAHHPSASDRPPRPAGPQTLRRRAASWRRRLARFAQNALLWTVPDAVAGVVARRERARRLLLWP
jgi:hypothetical protein